MHLNTVEYVILSCNKLKKNDSNWPNIGLICLLVMMKYRFNRHVGLSPDFIFSNNF